MRSAFSNIVAIYFYTTQKKKTKLISAHMCRDMTKPIKWPVRPAKTQISLGIRPVWSESSLSAWRNLGPLATHWAHSEDSDPTGRIPRLIWVFAGRTLILLVLSCRGSYSLTVSFVLLTTLTLYRFCYMWAASWQNQPNDLCAQRRLRSAWTSAQSNQSLRCPNEESVGL